MLPVTRWLVREACLLKDDLSSVHWMGRLAMERDAIHYSCGRVVSAHEQQATTSHVPERS